MQEHLTESEIEFCEFYSDPTALTECLIPENFNVPQSWPNCKCLILRPYQFAMQNYSYMYAHDPLLSPLENRKILKGAGDLYSIGARNLGKCESTENYCQLADGSLKKFGELINTKQNVISFNDKTLKLEKDIACFKDNGLKECYKIITKSGKELIVTSNHPLYTDTGWVNAENLSVGQYIATPRNIDINGADVDDNLAKVLGYMIGDGSCKYPSIDFTNINTELIKEFKDSVEYFDCSLKKHGKYGHYILNSQANKWKHDKNYIKQIVNQYKINCLSKDKIIPEEIFKWSNKSVGIFLNRLYACDGHVSQSKSGYIAVEIALASKKMIYQIQTLLLRFGIHSNIYYKKSKLKEKYFDAWRLNISTDVDKFLDEIGVKSKDNGRRNNKSYSSSDRLPNNLIRKMYPSFLNKKLLRLRSLVSYNPSS